MCGQFKHVHRSTFAPSKCATMGKINFLLGDLLSSKSLCPVTAPVSATCIHKTHSFASLHLSTTFPFVLRLVLNLNYYSPAVSLGCIHPSGFKFSFSRQPAGFIRIISDGICGLSGDLSSKVKHQSGKCVFST